MNNPLDTTCWYFAFVRHDFLRVRSWDVFGPEAMISIRSAYYQLKLHKSCVFLVDDMLSELDVDHRNRLANWLFSLNGQIFVTGVDKEELLNVWKEIDTDIAMFHVKHGNVAREH